MSNDPSSRIRTATLDEVRPVIDARLLTYQEPSDEERARGERFKELLAANAKEEMSALLEEGPLGIAWAHPDDLTEFIVPLKALGNRAAEEDLPFATLLLRRSHESASSMIQHLINVSVENSVLRKIANEARRLTDASALQALQEAIEPPETPELEKAILGEFHYGVLPGILDPVSQTRGKGAGVLFWKMGDAPPEAASEEWFGAYDPLETAKDLNTIFTSALANIDSTPSTYDRSGTMLAAERQQKLPKVPPGKNFVSNLQRRSAMKKLDAMENSIGWASCAIGMVLDDVARTGWIVRTHRELIRTLIAIRLHRVQFGQDPATLETLVSTGLLSKLPFDVFAEKPLRYDAKRRLLWSAGPDRKDTGGIFSTEGHPGQPDFGYHLDLR